MKHIGNGLQFIYWGFDEDWWKRWGFWFYPAEDSSWYDLQDEPCFYGLCLGIFEIRYFPYDL